MPKRRRQGKIPTPAWERPRGAIGSQVLGRGLQFYGLIVVLLLAGVAVFWPAYGFLSDELEERGRPGSTAIQVEDTRFRLDYFGRRLKIFVDQNGGQGAVQPLNALPAVADLIIQEEVIRRFAGERDVTATEQEITDEIATRLGISPDDESFEVVFQQELARSEISEERYRQMVEATVLANKLREQFMEQVPEKAESVRYRQILVSEEAAAEDIRKQIEDGGDFAALAAENSLDPLTRESGGEVSWLPRGVQDPAAEELIFTLDVGEISTIPTPSGVLIIEMLEKDDNRQVEEDRKGPLAERALADWVAEKREPLSIINNMDVSGDFDQGKLEWVVNRVFSS